MKSQQKDPRHPRTSTPGRPTPHEHAVLVIDANGSTLESVRRRMGHKVDVLGCRDEDDAYKHLTLRGKFTAVVLCAHSAKQARTLVPIMACLQAFGIPRGAFIAACANNNEAEEFRQTGCEMICHISDVNSVLTENFSLP